MYHDSLTSFQDRLSRAGTIDYVMSFWRSGPVFIEVIESSQVWCLTSDLEADLDRERFNILHRPSGLQLTTITGRVHASTSLRLIADRFPDWGADHTFGEPFDELNDPEADLLARIHRMGTRPSYIQRLIGNGGSKRRIGL